jgi:hypothetical protein
VSLNWYCTHSFTFLATIYLCLAYYIIYAAAYKTIFGLTLSCSTHLNRRMVRRSFVGKFSHQSLTFFGFMVLSRQLGARKRTRSNHDDISDLQVIALERRPSSRCTILSWMTVQNIFSPVSSCLELNEVRFRSSELTVILSVVLISITNVERLSL